MLRLPMPVWWAFCDAVRSRVFHLLADRMTTEGWLPLGCDGSRMECPRTAELEQSLGKSSKDKSAPTLWVIALVSLTTGVLWSCRIGDLQDGGTSLPDRSVGDAPPSGPPKRALGLRRGLRGLRLVRSVAEAAVLVSDPALFAGTTLQLGDGQGGGIHQGRVLVLDDDAENKSQPALHVRVIRVAAKKRHNDVWLVTNVLDPKRLPAELAARFYRMRWKSECFRTYKRVVKDVRLVSRTVPMVVAKPRFRCWRASSCWGKGRWP